MECFAAAKMLGYKLRSNLPKDALKYIDKLWAYDPTLFADALDRCNRFLCSKEWSEHDRDGFYDFKYDHDLRSLSRPTSAKLGGVQ